MAPSPPTVGLAKAVVVAVLTVLLFMSPTTCSAQSTNETNTTLPFFSLRISGTSWQTVLASNYTDVSSVVRTSVSDALDIAESNVIVVSLSVGSLLTIFLVESDTLTADHVVSHVMSNASLVFLQALYQVAANTTETISIISVAPEADTNTTTTVAPSSSTTNAPATSSSTAAAAPTTTQQATMMSSTTPSSSTTTAVLSTVPSSTTLSIPSTTTQSSTTPTPSTTMLHFTTSSTPSETTTVAPAPSATTSAAPQPTFLMRISGNSWEVALASNYSQVASAVQTTLSDTLNVSDSDVNVTSLTVGSLIAIFSVQSNTLSSAQIVNAVRVAPLASLQAIYQAASQSNETLTVLAISSDTQQGASVGDQCDTTCIAVAVVCSVVATVLIIAVVLWTIRFCRGHHHRQKRSGKGGGAPNLAAYGIFTTATYAKDGDNVHQPDAQIRHRQGEASQPSQQMQPIDRWEEEQVDQHEQPLPVHTMDYSSQEMIRNSFAGRGQELQHYYSPSTANQRR
ncbi:membrane-associated protein, putative [Bodo saltans]|uniref:Membrane-associated protein, putative n=1 Tax=Bodo saltans TaxID=75058 RepID=A0A0S4IXK8_BODSA|nr:membrane-associated protein, putative [Bodo saltans]|eukprot:CUG08180.1 membrane-associated protein, putative [Bodo saltans]